MKRTERVKNGHCDAEDAAAASRRVAQPHKAALLSRLNRVAGQIRGISTMIEQDRYCIDVLTQISAARSALDAISLQLLHDHGRGCVRNAIRTGGGEEAIEELMQVVGRLVR